MAVDAYNSTIAARTRTAQFIKDTPDLLAQFQQNLGSVADLDVIITKGKAAKAANSGQSVATGEQAGEVAGTEAQFAALQREYKTLMTGVRAMRDELDDEGAPVEVLQPIDHILEDQTEVLIKTLPGEGDRRVKKALKSQSQESVRAEIEKDAGELLGNAHLAPKFAARGVAVERLTKLRDDAAALSGRLATRTAKKGERQAATAAENAAVKAQSKKWSAIYGILARIDDERLEELLASAAKK